MTTPGARTPAVDWRRRKGSSKAAAPKASGARSARRLARELALRGLYEWRVGGWELSRIDQHMHEQEEFAACDAEHYAALLHGCVAQSSAIDQSLGRHLDRPINQLSPIEHGVLMIGVYELQHCLEIPYRVAINEAVELAKSYGGTDGHRYVNGVLDKCAADLRPDEVAARPAAR